MDQSEELTAFLQKVIFHSSLSTKLGQRVCESILKGTQPTNSSGTGKAPAP